MNKENIQRKKKYFSFAISAIYKWSAESIVKAKNNGEEMSQEDFFSLADTMLNEIALSMDNESKVVWNMAREDFEIKLDSKSVLASLGWNT